LNSVAHYLNEKRQDDFDVIAVDRGASQYSVVLCRSKGTL
jgi:hypothetical protein